MNGSHNPNSCPHVKTPTYPHFFTRVFKEGVSSATHSPEEDIVLHVEFASQKTQITSSFYVRFLWRLHQSIQRENALLGLCMYEFEKIAKQEHHTFSKAYPHIFVYKLLII